jgi:folate-binding protein YgfZ
MPFKTNRGLTPKAALSGFSLLGFSGPDAAAFLQAQLMNDLRELGANQWQWTGWLSAKGRLIALFALLRLDDQEFIAILPDYPAAELQQQLQRFVFRNKLRIAPVVDLIAAADLAPEQTIAEGSRNLAVGDKTSGLRLDCSGDDVCRDLLLLPADCALLGPPDAACDAQWLESDLAHGLPRLVASQRESWTPQMLSLERLRAFSLKKGCYPGQEIVARTHYLGQARRGLSRVLGAKLTVGDALKDEQDGVLGNVISVAADGGSGLAVVQLDKRGEVAWIGGQRVGLPPFLEGMQRPV